MSLNKLDTLDPNEEKDYSVDWAKDMTFYGDTIESSAWPVVPSGITMLTNKFNDTSATIWVKLAVEGAVGTNYDLTNRVTTAGGRILDQTITIRVRNR